MNSVFVLGAGASAHARVPLMDDFLEVAEDIYRSKGPSWPAYGAFKLVMRARAALQAVHSKTQFNIHNLEAVFAAFEMANLFGELGPLNEEDAKQLISSMRILIVETIERRMGFPVRQDGKIQPSDDYRVFGGLVREMMKRGEKVSVITFNYDVGADFGLWAHKLWVDYCVKPEADLGSVDEPVIELMKLHGSVNWAACSKCEDGIVPHLIRDIVHDHELRWRREGGQPAECRLNAAAGLDRLVHCHDNPCKSEPLIIAPTPNKGGFHRQIKHVWKRAATRLRDADNIFVIGYSWPNADQFFRELYALGTIGESILRRFWVIDRNPEVRKRYAESLLGPQAKARLGPPDTVGTPAESFSGGLQLIAQEFGIDPVLANTPRVAD